MTSKVRFLAVIVLGCCLVSIVSAGCESCDFPSSYAPKAGPPDYSKLPFWGMSADDIQSAIEYYKSNTDTKVPTSEWPPKIIMPTIGTDKFGSLSGYSSKFGDIKSSSTTLDTKFSTIKSKFGSTILSGDKAAILAGK